MSAHDHARPGPVPRAALPWEVWALLAGSFLVAAGYGVVAPALPVFARSFGVGVTAAAAVVSALPVLRLLFAPVSGRLVARVGERAMYLTGLLVVAASTGACALATSYPQLLVFRGLGGIGSTMFTVSAFSLVFRLAPPGRRGQVSGMFTGSFLLGGISGPALGGLLVAVDLHAPFVVYAAALVVATAVVGGLLARSSGVGVRPPEPGVEPLTISRALRSPTYRAALTSGLATGWAVQGVRVALIPLFVAVALGREPVWAGVSLTLFAVGDGVLLLVTSGLSDRRGRRPVVVAGLVLVAVGTACLGVLPDLVVLLVASLVAGAGSGLLQPAQGAAVADLVGSRRSGGPALSGFQMASDVGAVVGPVAAGALAEHAGFGVAFGVSGAVALVAVVVWLTTTTPGVIAGARGSPPEEAGTRAA
ncbi:MFS transporter [Actinomycetospora sp. TBRC 11914]|uniref:MFS transporter n=1 Tax=Actinomycetospora sp. TBRC 11914 TaxID=2729387 RepID=UPI00145EE0C6|nr:MFS transporter [Actinomycetospora sp. TBRC 11914]NMO88695.1 MFS transporter [Actinomycetospora sp. TBRC 11914]